MPIQCSTDGAPPSHKACQIHFQSEKARRWQAGTALSDKKCHLGRTKIGTFSRQPGPYRSGRGARLAIHGGIFGGSF